MTRITDIVFDVGRVLVDFSYQDLFAFLRDNGAEVKGIKDFVEKTDLLSYEYGHLSGESFIDNINDLLKSPLDRDRLTEKWVYIFKPICKMQALALALRNRFGVYLLSNTSALHWDYLLTECRLDKISDGALASFEVGAVKPEEKIFREAEKRFNLRPETTLFIDDLETNIAGAIACGWHGIHHMGVENTWKELTKFIPDL
ncbi:MAG: HAD family phosphatase [Nitrospira sp.]|jgi:putative hydrolase of the HAD superfamily|nr:HAD family phosphatase [Candidatus Manganitrophaceae bacterium]HIL35486.1 HAD family phosphatase [Candidatus Manganitrophaceae bacterium]